VPVVLDLWAEWCEPCKQLSPVLERLAADGAGSWVLAKIDVDANPGLAQALRVQGIPAVKAVWQGQLVAEFTGVIPEDQARQFVTELVRATSGGEPGGPGEEGAALEDPRLDAAEAALEQGDLAAAEAAYTAILAEEPDHPDATLALRQVQLFRRAEEAGPHALAEAEAAPDDVTAQIRAADFLLGTGDVDGAFSLLLDVVRRTAGEDRDQARKHLVELLAIVGDQDPRVGAARRALTLALF
jgi:putative thioredoxin